MGDGTAKKRDPEKARAKQLAEMGGHSARARSSQIQDRAALTQAEVIRQQAEQVVERRLANP